MLAAGCGGVGSDDFLFDGGDGSGDDNPAPPVGHPDNGSVFVHRSLLVDYTATWCQYCPYMIAALRSLESDAEWSDRVVIAASHGLGDKMWFTENLLEKAQSTTSRPLLWIDFREVIAENKGGVDATVTFIKYYVGQNQSEAAKAGISAEVSCGEETVTVTAKVKAAVEGRFAIGGLLVEDGIAAQQDNGTTLTDNFNIHDHVVRLTDGTDYLGYDLGEVAAGETAEHTFVWRLKEEWKRERCSIILYVTADGAVTNAVHLGSLEGSFPFEYEE